MIVIIQGVTAITVAVLSGLFLKDTKRRREANAIAKKHAEHTEMRADQRAKEGLLSIKLTSAHINLSIALAATIKAGCKPSEELDVALGRARNAADEFQDVISEIAASQIV